jgi:maleate isomerase
VSTLAGVDVPPRAALGVVVMSINTCAEPELRTMLPDDVGVFASRVGLAGTSDAELAAAVDDGAAAVKLLAACGPDAILFHCTAATVFQGPAAAADLERRLEGETGMPTFVTSTAVAGALRALGSRRVALVTPYDARVTEAEAAFLRDSGFEVATGVALDIQPLADYARRSADEWVETVAAALAGAAGFDAVFISCTNLRTAGAIERLEQRLETSVVTSNQAAAWHALQLVGGSASPAWGSLMAHDVAIGAGA